MPKQIEGIRVFSVPDLLRLPATAHSWIIEGLLRNGSQMLLAAPPKCGKSLIASEIALALAQPFAKREERWLFHAEPEKDSLQKEAFPGLRVLPPPDGRAPDVAERDGGRGWRVLVLSLEMREAEVADRIQMQLKRFGLPAKRLTEDDPDPKDLAFQLEHVFGLPGKKKGVEELKTDLDIVVSKAEKFGQQPKVEPGPDFAKLRKLIVELKPEIVIIDTLIQLHSLNENDNVLMKGLMRSLRRLIVAERTGEGGKRWEEPIAHIVLHHTRKESGQHYGPLTPEIMRGAGSVHGVADLVMLARKYGKPGQLEIHISSRSSFVPNFLLTRQDDTLTHKGAPMPKKEKGEHGAAERTKTAILNFLKAHPPEGDEPIRSKELMEHLEHENLQFSEQTVGKRIKNLLDDGLIKQTATIAMINKDGSERKKAKGKWTKCQYEVTEAASKSASLPKSRKAPRKKKKRAHTN